LGFRFTVPKNYRLINSAEAVFAKGQGPAEGSVVIFAGEGLNGRNMIELTSAVWKSFVKESPLQGLEDFTINGMEAITGWTTTKIQNKLAQVRIVAVRYSRTQAYYFLMVTPEDRLNSLNDGLMRMTYSFDRLSRKEAGNIKGRIIRVATVQRGDTIASLSRHMAYEDHRLDRFLVLNGLNSQSKLSAGQRVKLIVYGK
jgi:predicted Zn-dependent protease